MDINTKKRLRNGVEIPILGFGVWKASDKEAEQSVLWALEAGYRHIDTAKIYGNEAGVGRAVNASGIPRDQIFVTTKLWNDDMRKKRERAAFEQSLKDLCLEYVDLYLVHWPVAQFAESWKVMEEILASKQARAIGVCNFQIHHLEALLQTAREIPAVNQIESHPLLTQQPLLQYCEAKDMACEAWSPLGGEGARMLQEETIVGIAEKYGKTPAQIILRWDLQRGFIPLPKSVHKERIASNAALFDFTLDDADMAAINAMNQDKRIGPDPDNFPF